MTRRIVWAGLALVILFTFVAQRPAPLPPLPPAPRTVAPFEVFAREARDEAFAARRERFLRAHAEAMFERHGPGVRLDAVECRTTSCLARLEAPDDAWTGELVSAVRWGTVHQVDRRPLGGGRVAIEVAAVMQRELLDHATYEGHLTAWRRDVDLDLRVLRASMHDAQGGQ